MPGRPGMLCIGHPMNSIHRFSGEKHIALRKSQRFTATCVFWRLFIGREAAQVNLFVQLISTRLGQPFANIPTLGS
jgi:hypothetical protein